MADGSVNLYQKLIIAVLTNPAVKKVVGPALSGDTTDQIEKWLGHIRGQFYIPILDIEQTSVSPGLFVNDREISLSPEWGVKLNGSIHPYINRPTNIRNIQNRIYVSNSSDALTLEAFPAAVVDSNMNFVATIGSIGTSLVTGQYAQSDDFLFSPTHNKYFVVSTADNIIQLFDSKGQFVSSLGDGTAGIPDILLGVKLNKPVAVAIGDRGVYICCKEGVAGGATTKTGYIALLRPDFTFDSFPLFAGKNAGTGRLFEGEVDRPKDMVVLPNPDRLVVLNGNDEIGVFNAATGYTLEKLINIPAEIYSPSLGLSRIAVQGDVVYITASTTGEIIALSLSTGALVGKFGELKNESTLNSDQTLGVFNGISGVCFNGDKLVVSETLNNRIQQFGAYLVKNPQFIVDFVPVNIPLNAELHNITVPAGLELSTKINIIDRKTSIEYSRDTAIQRKTNYFTVRFYIEPKRFSMNKKKLELYPVYVLCEENNG